MRKTLMGAVALAIGLVMTVAFPASAHHNTIGGKVACATEPNTWTVTWTVTNSESNKSELITDSNREVVKTDTVIPKGGSIERTETVTSPGAITLTLTAVWPANGVTSTNSGTVPASAFDKGCWDTGQDDISFCHADGQSGNYSYLTTSVAAFYKAGHVSHGADIYPAGSFIKGGETISWPAQGDQSLLTTKCRTQPDNPGGTYEVVKKGSDCTGEFQSTETWAKGWRWDAEAWEWVRDESLDVLVSTSEIVYTHVYTVEEQVQHGCARVIDVSVTPGHDECGVKNDVSPVASTGEDYITERDGDAFVFTIVTEDVYFLVGGEYVTSVTLTGYPEPSDQPCPAPVIPTVQQSDQCGVEGTLALPADQAPITYAYGVGSDGQGPGHEEVVATLAIDEYYTGWGDLPEGWVDNNDGTATYGATLAPAAACPIQVTPVSPDVEQSQRCERPGSVSIVPTEGVRYTWLQGSPSMTQGHYRVEASAKSGYVLTEGAQTVFTGVLKAPEDCPVTTPPAATPQQPTLPNTGGVAWYWWLVGVVAVAGGVLLLVASSARRPGGAQVR